MCKIDADKLTWVCVNDNWYLCDLYESDKLVELRSAVKCERKDEDTFRIWITKQNIGELKRVRVAKNSGYSVEPLDAEQRRELKRLIEDMTEVKRTALMRLENTYFWDGPDDD